MFDPSLIAAVSELYASEPRTVVSLSVTGGGSFVIPMLYTVPGASRSLMDSQIPYARSAMEAMLGKSVDGSVSDNTAISMAISTRQRAATLLLADTKDLTSLHGINILGVSCTAALRSATPKRGDHRCHVACATDKGVFIYSIVLNKGARTREEEDIFCSNLTLDALIDNTCYRKYLDKGKHLQFTKALILDGESINCTMQAHSSSSPALQALQNVYNGRTSHVLFMLKSQDLGVVTNNGVKEADISNELECFENVGLPSGSFVYPGSFNPLHRGHAMLAQASLNMSSSIFSASNGNCPLIFEIAAVNADKPELEYDEIISRVHSLLRSPLLESFAISNYAVCVTAKPLFVQKSELFIGCNFIVGADTLVRILDPKYYGDKESLASSGLTPEQVTTAQHAALTSALTAMQHRDNRFVVGGREISSGSGDFLSCASIMNSRTCAMLPAPLKAALFLEVDETKFRVDLSSSQIRKCLK
jgi:hypothetical protein